MSRRPLVFVIGLTLGDYFLWNWSLNHNHDVFALIAGLSFPPLALMLVWMLAVGAAKLLARTTRRPSAQGVAAPRRNAAARRATQNPSSRQPGRTGQPLRTPKPAHTSRPVPAQDGPGQGSRQGAPARRIAA